MGTHLIKCVVVQYTNCKRTQIALCLRVYHWLVITCCQTSINRFHRWQHCSKLIISMHILRSTCKLASAHFISNKSNSMLWVRSISLEQMTLLRTRVYKGVYLLFFDAKFTQRSLLLWHEHLTLAYGRNMYLTRGPKGPWVAHLRKM